MCSLIYHPPPSIFEFSPVMMFESVSEYVCNSQCSLHVSKSVMGSRANLFVTAGESCLPFKHTVTTFLLSEEGIEGPHWAIWTYSRMSGALSTHAHMSWGTCLSTFLGASLAVLEKDWQKDQTKMQVHVLGS